MSWKRKPFEVFAVELDVFVQAMQHRRKLVLTDTFLLSHVVASSCGSQRPGMSLLKRAVLCTKSFSGAGGLFVA